MTDRDARMADEAASGKPVAEIAARYAVPEEYVNRVIEDEAQPAAPRGLEIRGNRIVLSFLVGWLAWLIAARASLWIVVLAGVITYVITTAIVSRRR